MINTPPPEHVLRGYRLGTLTPDECSTVEKWIAGSPAAVSILSRIQVSDPVLEALSGPLSPLAAEATGQNKTMHQPEPHPQLVDPAEPGNRLGNYRLGRLLGEGGMGQVYESEQPGLGRRVALKIIAGSLGGDDQVRARFIREARAIAQVDHENVVRIHDMGEDNGHLFIAMALLRGETLAERLKREGPLPACEVARIGREVAAGLGAAHAVRLVHRDIKPGNIWLTEGTGRVQLLDFGLAKIQNVDDAASKTRTFEDALTRPGAVMGTPAYMSPEQGAGAAVNHQSDLFSLGVVLYEAATGRKPFSGDSLVEVLFATAKLTPPAPHRVRGEIPAELSELIIRLLAKEPDERPATAADVAGALAELETPPQAPAPRSRRRRTVLAAVPFVFVVGFGGGVLASQSRAQQQGPPPISGEPREKPVVGEAGWGWNKPGAVERASTPAAYYARLADLVEEWSLDKTHDPVALSRRLLEFRAGCARLRLAELPLPDADKTALQDELRFWGQQITEQLVLLEALQNGPDARKKADDFVATVAQWLRAKAM